MPAIDPPIFQSPVIIQAIIKVSREAVILHVIVFNKDLLMENFIMPNRLRFPVSRNILEKYYN